MRKCVFGAGVEEEDGGEGGDVASAATVREAAVPLWAARRCILRGGVRRDRRKVMRTRDMFELWFGTLQPEPEQTLAHTLTRDRGREAGPHSGQHVPLACTPYLPLPLSTTLPPPFLLSLE
jgi:hypothetical protein